MTLLATCLGAVLIKGLTQGPLAWKRWRPWLFVAVGSALFWSPLLTLLYHETEVDFWWVFLAHLLIEGLMLWRIAQWPPWASMLAAVLNTLFFFVYFLLGNG